MKVRFQADYDFNQDIVAGVIRREPGIDFQTGHAAGLKGHSDDEVLELAAQNERLGYRKQQDYAKNVAADIPPNVLHEQGRDR